MSSGPFFCLRSPRRAWRKPAVPSARDEPGYWPDADRYAATVARSALRV